MDRTAAGPGSPDSLPEASVGAEAAAPVPSSGWTEASLALMVLIWGVNFAVAKHAIASFDPLAFNALRYFIASLFVFVVLRAQGVLTLPDRRDVPRILLLGTLGNFVYQMAFILGLERTRAGNASLMLALTPVFILLLGWRTERHGPLAWVGSAVSVVGVALVSGSATRQEGSGALGGDLLMLAACLIWAVYTMGSRPLIARYGSVQTTAWTLWTGGAMLVLAGIPAALRQDWGSVGATAWGGMFYSALFSIGLAYLLWYRGVERLGGARTAIYSNVTPVIAMVSGAVGLGERLTPLSLLGAGMVLGGVMLVRRG